MDDEMTEAVTQSLVLMQGARLANAPEFGQQLVRIWAQIMHAARLTPNEVRIAAANVAMKEKFWPQPCVLIGYARPAEDEEALSELAWQRTLSLLRRVGSCASIHHSDLDGDKTALWAISRVGWERLGRELTEDNRAIWRAEFVRIYRSGRKVRAELEYLPGLYERENSARNLIDGDLLPSLVGRPDWTLAEMGSFRLGRAPLGLPEPAGTR